MSPFVRLGEADLPTAVFAAVEFAVQHPHGIWAFDAQPPAGGTAADVHAAHRLGWLRVADEADTVVWYPTAAGRAAVAGVAPYAVALLLEFAAARGGVGRFAWDGPGADENPGFTPEDAAYAERRGWLWAGLDGWGERSWVLSDGGQCVLDALLAQVAAEPPGP